MLRDRGRKRQVVSDPALEVPLRPLCCVLFVLSKTHDQPRFREKVLEECPGLIAVTNPPYQVPHVPQGAVVKVRRDGTCKSP